MGYNISGLVINHNYERSFKNFEYDFGWGLEILDEISFGEASSNWTPHEEIRLHFTDKATMLFFTMDWVDNRYKSSHSDTLNYAYSETGMFFQFDYFKQGKLIRSFCELDGDILRSEGKKMKIEKSHDSSASVIFSLIDNLLDSKFKAIDFESISYRCKATNIIMSTHKSR